MEKTTIICDGCCERVEERPVLFKGIDLCTGCITIAVEAYLLSRNGKRLMGECGNCVGGLTRVVDNERTGAMASCGENRTQYKMVNCDECVF